MGLDNKASLEMSRVNDRLGNKTIYLTDLVYICRCLKKKPLFGSNDQKDSKKLYHDLFFGASLFKPTEGL